MNPSLLELKSVGKKYSGVPALTNVSLGFRRGEVHALVGENGAGKSTLVRILAGATALSSGEILIDGKPLSMGSPRDARNHGIAYVSQELSLLPARSVVENVLTGRLPTVLGILSRKRALRRFQELVEFSGLAISPDTLVKRLNLVEKEYVEILRAMAGDLKLLILDEPTTATTRDQADLILSLARRLADSGVCVILVSHALDDVLKISDRISVLRDGQLVKTVAAVDTDAHGLITAMIGRELSDQFPEKVAVPAAAQFVLEAEGIARAPMVNGVSLAVRAGEILGIGGLVGSGRTELVRCIIGVDRRHSGRVLMDGGAVALRNPRQAQRHGVVMVPENRKEQGLHLDHSLERNTTLPYLRALSRVGVLRSALARERADGAIERFRIKTRSSTTTLRSLSGGNQQRALFAKWLVETPRVLIVDEPTRGVDIAGKRAIYEFMSAFAARGGAVIVVSSEMPELIGVSHRIIVMSRGVLTAELEGAQMTEDNIAHAAFTIPLASKESRNNVE